MKSNTIEKMANVIADMALSEAKPEELEWAIKHSMEVIDAERDSELQPELRQLDTEQRKSRRSV